MMVATTARPRNIYRKRPDVDSRIATSQYGVVTVLATHRDGLELDVVDRLGRDWTIERARTGHWVLADEEA